MSSRACSTGGEGIRDDRDEDGLVVDLCGSAWLLSNIDKESSLLSPTKGIRIVDDIEIYHVGMIYGFGSATLDRWPSQKASGEFFGPNTKYLVFSAIFQL